MVWTMNMRPMGWKGRSRNTYDSHNWSTEHVQYGPEGRMETTAVNKNTEHRLDNYRAADG